MKPLTRSSEQESRAVGAFTWDGSWNERAEIHHRGHVHRLVVAMVRQRRQVRLAPELAAQATQAANAEGAFPNHEQWATCGHWALTLTTTSAEEAVKREGRGTDGHWCGERWMAGSLSECHDPRHRPTACPPEAQGRIAETFQAFEQRTVTP